MRLCGNGVYQDWIVIETSKPEFIILLNKDFHLRLVYKIIEMSVIKKSVNALQ